MLKKIILNLNLRNKFLFGSILLVVILGLAVLLLVQTTISQKLLSEVRERGILIAKNLASESMDPMLASRTEELQLFINEYKNSKQDIEYIFILDSEGRVLAHTFEKGFPIGLKNANSTAQIKKQNVKSLNIDGKNILDIMVPVLEGETGVVRVGISEEPIRKTVSNIIRLILGIITGVLLLGGVGVYGLVTVVTNPIYDLIKAAKTAGRGDLSHRVVVKTRDEIGELGLTFNNMVIALQKSRDELIQSREYVNNIIHYMYEALFVVSIDGYIKTVNEAACELLGYEEKELIGKSVESIFAEEDFMASRTDLQDLIKEEYVKNIEEEFLSKAGEKIPVIFSSSVMHDSKGSTQGIIFVAQSMMERKQLEEKLHHTLLTLRKAMKGAIQAMALTVERRDPFTSGHQQRVADLARGIAREMGLTDERIDGLRMCAVVHDLGKMFIPSDILTKSTKLTENEYNIIKTHPQAGYEILREIEFPWPIAEMELQHHERINGSGYPKGLMGKDMLLEAKILAVSDVVEAMVNKRSYHPAHSTTEALEEISKNKGILYDPDVVDACMQIFVKKGFKFKESPTEDGI
ncbi:MAG: PAS domain S-box protein [bacterium]|nr:PAS domain S-box protein [bacterium]